MIEWKDDLESGSPWTKNFKYSKSARIEFVKYKDIEIVFNVYYCCISNGVCSGSIRLETGCENRDIELIEFKDNYFISKDEESVKHVVLTGVLKSIDKLRSRLNDITVDLLDDFSDGKNAQNCP
jgi:hypothetical protein